MNSSMVLPSLFKRPKSSLMTQLAAPAVAALCHLFEEIRRGALGRQHRSVIGGQAIVLDEAGNLVVGQFGQRGLDGADPGILISSGSRSGLGK